MKGRQEEEEKQQKILEQLLEVEMKTQQVCSFSQENNCLYVHITYNLLLIGLFHICPVSEMQFILFSQTPFTEEKWLSSKSLH